jgi:hypothetical protein
MTHDHPAPDGATWQVTGIEPIFSVADAQRSMAHYRRLGFTTSKQDEYYAFAHRGHLTIHPAHADGQSNPISGSIYMHVDDADGVAIDWRSPGFDVVGPEDFDYGKREGSHRDPDGNLIRFGSPLRRAPSDLGVLASGHPPNHPEPGTDCGDFVQQPRRT